MKIGLALLCVVFLSADIGSSVASAALMVYFDPSSPTPLFAGSSGTIDVLIHGDPSDRLDSIQLNITLTPVGLSAVGGLKFSALQLDAQLTDNQYVFFDNSLSQTLSQPVGAVNPAGDLFAGYDATFDFKPISLSDTDQLLFRLNLDALSAGSYSIGIDPSLSSFSSDQLDPVTTTIDFSSTPGTITVADAAAVPEPSSAILLGLACVFGVLHRRVSKKHSCREAT